jgi:hypothetical protein
MTSTEKQLITDWKYFLEEGFLTQNEFDWCMGALKNRHDLSKETRYRLRDATSKILDKVKERMRAKSV